MTPSMNDCFSARATHARRDDARARDDDARGTIADVARGRARVYMVEAATRVGLCGAMSSFFFTRFDEAEANGEVRRNGRVRLDDKARHSARAGSAKVSGTRATSPVSKATAMVARTRRASTGRGAETRNAVALARAFASSSVESKYPMRLALTMLMVRVA